MGRWGAQGLLPFNTRTYTLSPGGEGHTHTRMGHTYTDRHTDMHTPNSLPWSLDTLGAGAPAGVTLVTAQSPSIGPAFLKEDPTTHGWPGPLAAQEPKKAATQPLEPRASRGSG